MPSLNSQLYNRFVGHDVNLQRFQEGQRQTLLRELKRLEKQIVARLQKNGGESFTKIRQRALLTDVREIIRTGYKGVLKKHKASILEAALSETDKATQLVNSTVGAEIFTVGVSETTIKSMLKDEVLQGSPLRQVWEQEAGSLYQAFASQMRQGILAGETVDELIRRVGGTAKNNYKDGIMDPRKRAVEMRVRTSGQSILNDARMETFRANQDVLQGVQAQVTLDGKTSDICISRSGMAWDFDGNPLNEDTDIDFPGPPPWHPNCRTALVPITKSIGDLLGDPKLDKQVQRELDKLPERTQASMDGQVSATLTYEDWLRTKSEPFQQEVLGPSKWKLWQSGQISLRDLVDQRGNPLTLAQLKKL